MVATVLQFPAKDAREWALWEADFRKLFVVWGGADPSHIPELLRRIRVHWERQNAPRGIKTSYALPDDVGPITIAQSEAVGAIMEQHSRHIFKLWADEDGRTLAILAKLEFDLIAAGG